MSPTDPVAISGILKSKKDLLPKYQRFIIAGESLFNDAVSVVLFMGNPCYFIFYTKRNQPSSKYNRPSSLYICSPQGRNYLSP